MRLAVVIVAYEAATTIGEVLDRLPVAVPGWELDVLVADDASTDATVEVARAWAAQHPAIRVEVCARPDNLGYGGNQKACYRWAVEGRYDAVVLLHGDAQYPPERIAELVEPIGAGRADLVFGSRMVQRGGARAGGMPAPRFVGNRVLNPLLNRAAGTQFSEWFSGFRAYRTSTLAAVGFEDLPDGFDFDTAILFRFVRAGARWAEFPIPTRYEGSVSRVPLVRTGLLALRHAVRERPPTLSGEPLRLDVAAPAVER